MSTLPFCTNCWLELRTSIEACPYCGAGVDQDTRSFDEQLKEALQHSFASARVRICWILGHKRDANAIPVLMQMLNDGDLYVQIAAAKALRKIVGGSAAMEFEKLMSDAGSIVRLTATPSSNPLLTTKWYAL